jgi:hypothetical protein
VENLIAWIVSFMIVLAPPGRPSYIPEATETKDDANARYASIAQDITTVVWSAEEKPLFRGTNGRARTTALILSIMLNESGFRKDVDLGVGKHARGDGGRSWCLMQMNLGTGKTRPWNQKKYRFAKPPCQEGRPADPRYCDPAEEIIEGVTGREMVEARKLCIREGLHALHGALCTALPTREWLRAYASGSCDKGSEESRRRMDLAISWYSNHRPGFTDADVMNPQPTLPPTMPNALILALPPFNVAINDALIPRAWVR